MNRLHYLDRVRSFRTLQPANAVANKPEAMPMLYKQLGETDLRVSSIGLGCVTFGREIDAATSFSVLDRAAERGINLLDTAAVYGDGASEDVIGRWLRDRGARNRFVVATKVSGRLTREHINQSVEASLRRLGTDRIDLLQAHDWDAQTPLDETLAAFDDLVKRGEVRFCGCSNWDSGHLKEAFSIATDNSWSRLESIQPIYNLVYRQVEKELLEFCNEHRLGMITYSPLGAGFLTGKYRRGAAIPTGTRFAVKPAHQDVYFTDHGFQVMETLRTLAVQVGVPMAQLALGWVLSRPGIASVLIGARQPRHIDRAFEAAEAAFPRDVAKVLDEL